MPKIDENGKLGLARKNIDKFLTDTLDARALSEKCRDYHDHKQWTAEEEVKLEARHQAPIVVNRIKPKVEGLLGLYNMRQGDPKAYARTQAHEEASHVVTDALRFVADNNNMEGVRLDVAENFFIEGYGGAMREHIQKKNGEIEIKIRGIPWDRIYFDPHSRIRDFSDARYMGIIQWMYIDEAKELFPGVSEEAFSHAGLWEDETFEDRPRWSDPKNRRIRVALHFEIYRSVWHMAILNGDNWIVPPQPSPFLDEDGEPTNPIELVSANIDRDNGRYGEVAGLLSQQDELNHRRSKFLHFLNSRQTFGRKGDTDDVAKIKRELSKPDGHVEFEGDQFGKDFGIIPNNGADQGQFLLYQDAKAEMDATSFNAQLAGERQEGDLSGRAIAKLQQAGTLELSRQYQLLQQWENRIYRQMWAGIKQVWDKEKWIRITDDQDALRWVGFNVPMTLQDILEEKINDKAQPIHVRKMAAATFVQMTQAQDPRLQELVQVKNALPELDVDIILEQSFDTINIQEEQFEILARFANTGDVDIVDLIQLSQLRGKSELIDKIESRRQAALEQQGGAAQMAAQEAAAKTENIQANTAKTLVDAQQKQVETEMLIRNPDPQVQAHT